MTIPGKVKFSALVLAGHKQAAAEVPFDPSEKWNLPMKPIQRGRRGAASAIL